MEEKKKEEMERFKPPAKEANIIDKKSSALLNSSRSAPALLEAIAKIKADDRYAQYYPARPHRAPHAKFNLPTEYRETVALASYPRSGNSLLRNLLETVTGTYTGSDSRPMRWLSEDLRDRGLLGESIVGKRVWVVKTHYPERSGWKHFHMHRSILLVRNPFNAIDSYFNMTLTGTHDHSIEEEEYARFPEAWQDNLEVEAPIWRRFHEWWLAQRVPVLVVRFEDLVSSQPAELDRILVFLCELDTDPSRLEQFRAKAREMFAQKAQAGAEGAAAGVVYQPRTKSIRAKLAHYSQEQQQLVLRETSSVLGAFGYTAADLGCECEDADTEADAEVKATAITDTVRAAGRITEVNRVNPAKRARANEGAPAKSSPAPAPAGSTAAATVYPDPSHFLRSTRQASWKWELRDLVHIRPLKPKHT